MSETANGKIRCPVCFRRCELAEGQTGFCKARKNEGGRSVSLSYGKITSLALDPIEKKPLARFYAGSSILSAGSFGCNLNCPYCQNDSLSRAGENDIPWSYVAPDEFAALARGALHDDNIGAAYTYNEPMIGFEYVRDAGAEIRKAGMQNVVVTNGSVALDALAEVQPYVDAYNIDLKGFTDEWYKKLGGDLAAVLAFIREAAKGAHVELTALIVPQCNDSEKEMRELASWIASVDKSIPLHVTRFFPRHRMCDREPTDISLLFRLADIAREKLDTVLVGNV